MTACLSDAFRVGSTAYGVVNYKTAEGAPVPVTYQVRPGGKAEVFVDWSNDPLGSGGERQYACDSDVWVRPGRLNFLECQD